MFIFCSLNLNYSNHKIQFLKDSLFCFDFLIQINNFYNIANRTIHILNIDEVGFNLFRSVNINRYSTFTYFSALVAHLIVRWYYSTIYLNRWMQMLNTISILLIYVNFYELEHRGITFKISTVCYTKFTAVVHWKSTVTKLFFSTKKKSKK